MTGFISRVEEDWQEL